MSAPTSARLHVATYNIHKGFSQFNSRMMVHELRGRLRTLGPDVVFLQEVQGLHLKHADRYDDWPESPQHEFLAQDVWGASAYGQNVMYDHGHHGNAILSRHPIVSSVNHDVTDLRFERRGMLHCELNVPGMSVVVHCVCVHLSLFAVSRARQMTGLVDRLAQWAPGNSPLVIAGDFNDWRNRGDTLLADRLGLTEVFAGERGLPARSFPVRKPTLRLDRIYVRGFSVESTQIHAGVEWSKISDHAALSAVLVPTPPQPAARRHEA
jgi:endonuclease/exonuclease/phosphatase family metal-dependent hydrolase